MKKYKFFLLSSLAVFLLLLLVHMTILVIVDPLSITGFKILNREFFIKEMRFQVAGIINNFDFDSAIVGTSMAENFDAEEASKTLGGKFVNLSLSGSLLKERKVVLDYLLSEKKIKTLIISLDDSTDYQRNGGIPIESWSFLYDGNYWNNYFVYANRKYMPYINCHSIFKNRLVSFLFGACPARKTRDKISSLTEWQSDPAHNKRFGGVDNWIKNRDNEQVKQSIHRIINATITADRKPSLKAPSAYKLYDYSQFKKYIIPLVKHYKNTRFILFFPPYSIFEYAILSQSSSNNLNDYLNFVKDIILETEQYHNVELYWFGNHNFVNHIANYKDLDHYNGSYNSMFLKEFSEKKSIINKANYFKIINEFQQRVKKVDLRKLAEKFRMNRPG